MSGVTPAGPRDVHGTTTRGAGAAPPAGEQQPRGRITLETDPEISAANGASPAGHESVLPFRLRRRTIRLLVLLCAALVVWRATALTNRDAVAMVLLVGAALQVPLANAGRTRTLRAVSVALGDITIAAAVVIAEPALWPVAAMWSAGTVMWQAVVAPRQLSILVTSVAACSWVVAGLVAGSTETWVLVVALQGLVVGVFTRFGWHLRRHMADEVLQLATTVSAAGAVVTYADLELGHFVDLQGDIARLTGYSRHDFLATDLRELIHPDDVADFWIDVGAVESDLLIDRVGRLRRADGRWIWVREVARVSVDRSGRKSMRGLMFDVTAVEESKHRIACQARIDVVTGLPNRLALTERLTDLIESGGRFALMLIDLNRFKEVNDTLGHEAGDDVLAVVAGRLGSVIGPNDQLARLGGDEFAIIVGGAVGPADVLPVLDRISAECSRPITVRGIELAMSLSTGVAFYTAGVDRATIMRHADIAMYEAKRSGAAHRVFDSSLEQTSTMQLSLSAALADALASGAFHLYFQPKFDLVTGDIIGAEGLARWHHPQFGVLSPDAFLEIALMSESVGRFTTDMIRQAVDMIRRTAETGQHLPIAVNVAMRALRDGGLAGCVLDLLRSAGVPPGLLTIEITENDVDDPSPDMLATLDLIRRGGVGISVDDFGTGQSSLDRLREFRVDELKIDRAFVDGIIDHERDRQIVRSIIGLADGLGYGVVAEGVERPEQVDVLVEMGCATAQGFLFSPPMPADDFLDLLHSGAVAPVQRLTS